MYNVFNLIKQLIMELHPILDDYILWTNHHDKDYCYDELHNFLVEYSREESSVTAP